MPDEIKFGTAEYKGKWAGLVITSIKKDANSQKVPAMDENGRITQINRYGEEETVQIEANVKGDIAALKTGADLTVDEKVYGIDTVSTTRTNTGHHTASITASRPADPPAEPPAGG